MRIIEAKVGARVDLGELKNGEIVKVGLVTVWADFTGDFGVCRMVSPAEDFRLHLETTSCRVGEWLIRAPGSEPGKIQIYDRSTGEMMEADVIVVEAWIAKFWNKHF